jgi:hypothetical protein
MIYLLERVFAFVSVCVYVWLCVSLSLFVCSSMSVYCIAVCVCVCVCVCVYVWVPRASMFVCLCLLPMLLMDCIVLFMCDTARQHKIRCCLGLISVQYGVTAWFAEMRVHMFCISTLKLM